MASNATGAAAQTAPHTASPLSHARAARDPLDDICTERYTDLRAGLRGTLESDGNGALRLRVALCLTLILGRALAPGTGAAGDDDPAAVLRLAITAAESSLQ